MNYIWESVRGGIACHDQTPLRVWKGMIVGIIIFVVASLHIGFDQRSKSLVHYEQDNQPFKGASLVLAQRLAKEIVIQEAVVERQGDHATVRTTLSLPAGNADEVSHLLLAPGGFEEAPGDELEERTAKLEALIAGGQLPRLEAEDTWILVRDPAGWRIRLEGEAP
jgi:hypothetical protein